MAAFRPEGLGQEALGDPLGAGGPLFVVRARAVEGQTVRVVFDEEPVHRSAVGLIDALNPSNYVFTIVAGQAVQPQPVGVKQQMLVGPVAGVAPGDERGFDVQTDRPLVRDVLYRITARNILSKFGGALGVPHEADFPGMVKLKGSVPSPRPLELVDIAGDPFVGGFVLDDSGDIATQGSMAGLRKRILRRLVTPLNAFRFLTGYGIGIRLKQPMATRRIQEIKANVIQQVKLEPEVETAGATLTLRQEGALFVLLQVRTKQGAAFDIGTLHSTDGSIIVV